MVESGRSSQRTAGQASEEATVDTVDGVALVPEARLPAHEDVSAPLDPRFTFENFVVGKSNELAYAAARRAVTAVMMSATRRSNVCPCTSARAASAFICRSAGCAR